MTKRSPRGTVRDVRELVQRYGLSVAEAHETVVPCGNAAGLKMGELIEKDVYWFATRTTSMKNKPEFRKAVSAARIIRAERAHKRAADDRAINTATHRRADDAKVATVMCRGCKRTFRMGRHKLDRRNCRCLDCGGMLEVTNHLPLDEVVTTKEASQMFGLARDELVAAVDRGEVAGSKISNRWVFGLSSVQRFADKQAERKRLLQSRVDVSHGHICPRCKKVFRNYSALKLHIEDNHEDF
ncbi:MAG: helix-turn-helix domain-containing protein [Planctomycetota bacterium]